MCQNTFIGLPIGLPIALPIALPTDLPTALPTALPSESLHVVSVGVNNFVCMPVVFRNTATLVLTTLCVYLFTLESALEAVILGVVSLIETLLHFGHKAVPLRCNTLHLGPYSSTRARRM